MLCVNTPDNMKLLVREFGFLKREQLIRFFSDSADTKDIEFFIAQFVKKRVFDYDKDSDIVKWHSFVALKDYEVSRRIRAFWVIVPFGSNRIRDFVCFKFPLFYEFITMDNEVYDVSLIDTLPDANVAQRYIASMMVDEQEDDVIHIALTKDKKLGQDLSKYNFDMYCVLDKNNTPEYGFWE